MLKTPGRCDVAKPTCESTKESFLPCLHSPIPTVTPCRTGPRGLPGSARTLKTTPTSPPWSPETAAGPGPGVAAPPPAPVALGSCSRGPRPRRGSCRGYFVGLSPRRCYFSSVHAPPRLPGTPDPSLGLCMSRRCCRHRLTLKLALGFLLPAWAVPVGVPQCSFLGSQHPQFGASSHFCPKLSLKINTVKFFFSVMFSSLVDVMRVTSVPVE